MSNVDIPSHLWIIFVPINTRVSTSVQNILRSQKDFKRSILQSSGRRLQRITYFSTHTLPAAPVTSSLAMILMPCFPKAGAFLLFLPVPFSSLWRSAANVTSSIAECTCNTQLNPAVRMLFNSSRAICASNDETQWTGRCGAQSTKPGKMSSSSTPRIRNRTWSPQVAIGTSSSVSPYNAEMVMSSRLGCTHFQISIITNPCD